MYKVTIKSIRPDTTKEFFRYDDDMYDYIDEVYLQTNKLLGKKVSMTKSQGAGFISFINDLKIKKPVYFFQNRRALNKN